MRERLSSEHTRLCGTGLAKPTPTRHIDGMNIELSTLEERAEAEEDLAEALRILNRAIRRVHKSGLFVQAEVLSLHSPDGTVPQLNLSTLDRQYGVI